MSKWELSDVVRKAAMGLGLGLLFSQIDPQAIAAPVTSSQDSEKQDEKQPYKSRITYEQAKKGSKRTKRDFILGKMYEMGILYHKDHCPGGNVGDVFDLDDSSDRKRLEKRCVEEAKFASQATTPKELMDAYVGARSEKIAMRCRDPPGQNERLPFITFYLNEIFSESTMSEDDITNKMRYIKADSETWNTGNIFGKPIPLKNPAMKFWRGSVGEMASQYAALIRILDGTDKVSESRKQEVLKEYLDNYRKCMSCINIKEDKECQEFVKSAVDTVNAGVTQLGYVHKYDDSKRQWSLEKPE
jgi:hypothetical protein